MRKSRIAMLAAAMLAAATFSVVGSSDAHATTWAGIELTSATGALSGWCIEDPSTEKSNGNLMLLDNCNGSTEEKFTTTASEIGPGWYEIVSEESDKCLDDTGNGGPGTKVEIWTCNGSAAQAVCWDPYTNGYWPSQWEFATGYVLNDYNNVKAAGNWITMATFGFDNANAWNGPYAYNANQCP
jgi:Ricin-type beta-trefoil lectin domain